MSQKSDPWRRVSRAQLHPRFLSLMDSVLVDLEAQELEYLVLEGWRSPERQLELYQQGRTKPGKRVTNLQFGWHCLGMSVDVVPVINGSISWDPVHYEPLANAVVAHGLTSGHFWTRLPDSPHCELPVSPSLTLGALKRIYEAGGLEAVWRLVDARAGRA